jgi:hypothetical protein
MADEDQIVRMPMGDDRWHDAEIRIDNGDDERWDENAWEEEEDSDNDDDDDNDDSISDDEVIEDEIVEKFIRTFSIGDYDIEFASALSYDRSVVQPARPKQASYNKPDNWRERNRLGLERVKGRLQTCINLVSRGKRFKLYLAHNNGWDYEIEDNEEPIVWHEAILDEYWDQLEEKIDERKQLGIVTKKKRYRTIHIENVEMSKERLATLVTTLSGQVNKTESIIFNNTNLCEEGIISLSKLVDVSSKLMEFCLHHNRIDNMDSARCISKSLKSHGCINSLNLTHCDLGSSPEILLVILQSDIKYINLSNNNIDSLGAVKIAEYLEGDPPIHRIDLDRNRLNDNDAILISQALKRNTNMLTLFLHANNFTSIGVKALLTCVFDNSSLNAISESNHTLEDMNFFSDNNRPIKRLQGCINKLLELDWTQKIVLALQDKDSLLQYLANVPVELIPEVLAFPHGRVDDQNLYEHLNIVYSTMRWWNMPMLYSYYHCCVNSNTKRKREMTF